MSQYVLQLIMVKVAGKFKFSNLIILVILSQQKEDSKKEEKN